MFWVDIKVFGMMIFGDDKVSAYSRDKCVTKETNFADLEKNVIHKESSSDWYDDLC